MNRETLEAIYTILVDTCGAQPAERMPFIMHHLGRDRSGEWRFQGHLGFGGKLKTLQGPPYVDCYHEDLTPERHQIIQNANAQLVQFNLTS